MKVLGKPLAVGATADVHVWEAGRVLKLFHAGLPQAYAESEARVAGAVYAAVRAAGSPLLVPAVGPVVAVGDRYGLVYERIEGRSLSDVVLQTRPHPIVACARRLAELHAAIHAVPVTETMTAPPSQREQLRRKIDGARGLSVPLRYAAQQALARLPDEDEPGLCHGDFHPANVLLTEGGEAVVIDWHDATRGTPLADVARTSLLLRLATAPPPVPSAGATLLTDGEYETARKAFHAAYLARYFELRPTAGDGSALLRRWLPVIAAARLDENVAAAEQERLRSLVENEFS